MTHEITFRHIKIHIFNRLSSEEVERDVRTLGGKADSKIHAAVEKGHEFVVEASIGEQESGRRGSFRRVHEV